MHFEVYDFTVSLVYFTHRTLFVFCIDFFINICVKQNTLS